MQETKDAVSIPRLGRSLGGGHSNPLQYSLENPMDRGAWRATIHSVRFRQDWSNLAQIYFVIFLFFSFCFLIHLDFSFVLPGGRKGFHFKFFFLCFFIYIFLNIIQDNVIKNAYLFILLWSHNIPLYNGTINYLTSPIMLEVWVVYCISPYKSCCRGQFSCINICPCVRLSP